ncbi:hypothetical protein PsYK624_115300 [Phanerochaete sordida]|uniref:Uncharacterized protein n=1 Tax=Phanerochaete sordida TaxID=48140 RepID=A0A9P3GI32_9APHY|nr:hypothetical protein PsYK624_115300 [Phanerochaete sordida]
MVQGGAIHVSTPFVPQELIDYIIDAVQGDGPTLKRCSLVGKAWLPRCSRAIFHSFRISGLPTVSSLSNFSHFLISSPRISVSIRSLELYFAHEFLAPLGALITHLQLLESLTLTGVDLVEGSFHLTSVPECTGRSLKLLSASRLPMDTISHVQHLFAAVDSLQISSCTRGLHGIISHVVRELVVHIHGTDALEGLAKLVDPTTLQSLVLDLSATYYHGVDLTAVDAFLRVVGAHLKHLEYIHAAAGWLSSPIDLPGLQACSELRSIVMRAPQSIPFNHNLWLETVALLAFIPRQTSQVKLATACKTAKVVVQAMPWDAVGAALEHCDSLDDLRITVFDFESEAIPPAEYFFACEVILQKLPRRLSRVTHFV